MPLRHPQLPKCQKPLCLLAAVVGLLFVSPLSPEETGNDNSRRKHDDNDRCNTHHDASPNNAKMHYKILQKHTYPLKRGL
jgi:hypothetical protein